MFEVRVGGLVFESDPRSFDSAFVVEPEGLTGWYDGPGTRGASVDRPMAHGAFDLPVFRGVRVVTVSGNVIASSEFELVKLRDSLTGLLADGELGVLTVADSGGAQHVSVRLSGDPKFSPHPSGLEGAFQVAFKAVDPRKYGEQHSFEGSTVQVHHYGNFTASPVIEVVGPRAAYTVSGPDGRAVQVTQALAAGQSHRIDFLKGRVYRNGSLQFGVLSEANFWTLPPGKRTSMSISSGSMTVHVDDTYM